MRMKKLPSCPKCNKSDKVFASHMFGRKDLACVRCHRTFQKPRRSIR
jgi:ssDNA-binding Zn-finger/Zn-ribbon topoisomerase 1